MDMGIEKINDKFMKRSFVFIIFLADDGYSLTVEEFFYLKTR